MADYELTAATEPCAVIRISDNAWVPPDMANRDYNGSAQSPGYLQWKDAGGVPDPYVPPPEPKPELTVAPETTLLYEHENRLLELEGKPPTNIRDFVKKVKAG